MVLMIKKLILSNNFDKQEKYSYFYKVYKNKPQ